MIASILLSFLTLQELPCMTKLEKAIWQVETGSRLTGDEPILGDNGKSRGPLQISKAAWIDARMPGTYELVDDLHYSLQVFRRYQARYAREDRIGEVTWEKKARIWNGGPNGHKKKATLPYWAKVEKEIGK